MCVEHCIGIISAHEITGLLATLTGFIGGLHYGFGKGTGALVGGAVIAVTGSTAMSFRYANEILVQKNYVWKIPLCPYVNRKVYEKYVSYT